MESRGIIIGYGSQAKAWALNLRDSGAHPIIALRKESPSYTKALQDGFEVIDLENLPQRDYYALLIPDHAHEQLLENTAFPDNALLVYAHGLSLEKDKLQEKFPQYQHVLFAPKAIATELRGRYELELPMGAIASLQYARAESKKIIEALSQPLGIGKVVWAQNVKEEVHADLICEQTLLCSVIPFAAYETFEMMRKRGIQSESAFLESWHEMGLIVKALTELGPLKFFETISPAALVGAYKGRKTLFDEGFMKKFESLFDDIQSGEFFKELDEIDLTKVRRELCSLWESSELTPYTKEWNR